MEISIYEFLGALRDNNLLLLNVLLTLGVIFVNGFTDAPNAIATAVCTRCMGVSSAIIMSGVLNFFGVLITTMLNSSVAKTISNIIDLGENSSLGLITLASALFSVIAFGVIAWAFAIPTSESHALISGLTGSAVALRGVLDGINYNEWLKVIVGLIVSVAVGFMVGSLICKLVVRLFKSACKHSSDIFFRYASVVSATLTSFMHGAQDGQKFMGVIIIAMFVSKGNSVQNDINIPLWLIIICAVTLGFGTLCGGKKIIKSVGVDMVHLEKFQGFSSDLASSLSLALCTAIGCPVSTTHVKTATIVGVGRAVNKKAVNLSIFRNMALVWGLTFPVCAFISFFITKLFLTLG